MEIVLEQREEKKNENFGEDLLAMKKKAQIQFHILRILRKKTSPS